jgi:AraC family transcriptional regulator, activator of mtrCDE
MLDRSGESALAAVLKTYQLRAIVTANPKFCGHWRARAPANRCATFHLIADGTCFAQSSVIPEPVALTAGDLIVFPRGTEHDICSAPDAPAAPHADGPGDARLAMVCGELDFITGQRNPVLDALPDYFVVRGDKGVSKFGQLAVLMRSESDSPEFGSQAVLDKLADAMFVMAVRSFINQSGKQRGLLAALLDPRLARALDVLHGRPGDPWTVATLARACAMSRTAFAQRFGEVIGKSPHHYLTDLRMTEALRMLRDPRLSVLAIAETLGYQSEAAFRRSFKRVHGSGPGAFRRASPTGEADPMPRAA